MPMVSRIQTTEWALPLVKTPARVSDTWVHWQNEMKMRTANVTLQCFPCCVKLNWHLHFGHCQELHRSLTLLFHNLPNIFLSILSILSVVPSVSPCFFLFISFLAAFLANGVKASLASQVLWYSSTLGCKEMLIFNLSWENWNVWLDSLAAGGRGCVPAGCVPAGDQQLDCVCSSRRWKKSSWRPGQQPDFEVS